jgi:hypothetical protein
MERVRGLLTKLGEIPSGQQDPRPVRFVQPSVDTPTAELLQRLRDAWSATGQNELIIKLPEKPPAEATKKEEKEEKDEEGKAPNGRGSPAAAFASES